jgi:lysophospholipase L1-like esterase
MGHNDIATHPVHNTHPDHAVQVMNRLMNFATQVNTDFPLIIICTSAIFPRTYTDHSTLDPESVSSYNRIAKRQGQRTRTEAKARGYKFSLNMSLWGKISKAEENPAHYTQDGLHLNDGGKELIAKAWLADLVRPDQ